MHAAQRPAATAEHAGPRNSPPRTWPHKRAGRARVAARATPSAAVVLPGLGNSTADYVQMAKELESRGCSVEVADVSRLDWARNAYGLRFPEYWLGTLSPRPTVDWYLWRVDAAMDRAKRAARGGKVALVAHSAGGWLGRLYLRDFGCAGVTSLVTLGTPHLPPPPGVIDQTRGILTYCEREFPGCHHEGLLRYTSVAGKHVRGVRLDGEGTVAQKVAGLGYKQVCGSADVWGDGIVPVESALLPGSRQLVLEGVYHSPIGASEQRPWYGSPGVLDKWYDALFEEETGPVELTKAPEASAPAQSVMLPC